jgi:hypothetical protein
VVAHAEEPIISAANTEVPRTRPTNASLLALDVGFPCRSDGAQFGTDKEVPATSSSRK